MKRWHIDWKNCVLDNVWLVILVFTARVTRTEVFFLSKLSPLQHLGILKLILLTHKNRTLLEMCHITHESLINDSLNAFVLSSNFLPLFALSHQYFSLDCTWETHIEYNSSEWRPISKFRFYLQVRIVSPSTSFTLLPFLTPVVVFPVTWGSPVRIFGHAFYTSCVVLTWISSGEFVKITQKL